MQIAARRAAELVKKHRNDSVEVISHMDADGVCAAALTSKALDRLDIIHNVKFVRMLYRDVVEDLDPADLTIFTDLGSSQLQNLKMKFAGKDVIIADHHAPERTEGWPELVHLNAHHYNMNGVQEVSGSGMAYLIAKELDEKNSDLAALAVVGAIGDVQDAWGKLVGHNRKIAKDAISAGTIEMNVDMMLYGRHTRPIFKALEFFTDPLIPGVSNSPSGCLGLLKELNIPLKDGEDWRKPADLTHAEKQRLASELITRAYMSVPEDFVKYVPGLVIGETYSLPKEKADSMLMDAEEFSTCMNSTARHEQPLLGFEVAKGDRGTYYRAMLKLIRHHRRCIAEGMEFIEENGLSLGPKGYLQYFDATGVIKETFIGTIANMVMGYKNCDPYKPVIGMIRTDGVAKVSARCSKLLFLKGLDMAKAIRESAQAVGGEGGGHAVACGAQVKEDQAGEFLQKFEVRLQHQLSNA